MLVLLHLADQDPVDLLQLGSPLWEPTVPDFRLGLLSLQLDDGHDDPHVVRVDGISATLQLSNFEVPVRRIVGSHLEGTFGSLNVQHHLDALERGQVVLILGVASTRRRGAPQ